MSPGTVWLASSPTASGLVVNVLRFKNVPPALQNSVVKVAPLGTVTGAVCTALLGLQSIVAVAVGAVAVVRATVDTRLPPVTAPPVVTMRSWGPGSDSKLNAPVARGTVLMRSP